MKKFTTGRSSKYAGEGKEPHDRWLISYADLVTLLFTLFVVLYAASDHDRASKVAEAMKDVLTNPVKNTTASPGGNGIFAGSREITDARTAMEQAFAANETLRSRARILNTKDGFIVSLAEAGFFAPGDANVRDDARTLIETMADALRNSSAKLRVEGHTDSTPISTARYPSNWELSSARASIVLTKFLARGIPPSRLALAGYGGEQPIADNATPEGRAQNRRVDLVILQNQQ